MSRSRRRTPACGITKARRGINLAARQREVARKVRRLSTPTNWFDRLAMSTKL